jgi:threonine dehydrogenase-like Zn-dependent dehydrogenase
MLWTSILGDPYTRGVMRARKGCGSGEGCHECWLISFPLGCPRGGAGAQRVTVRSPASLTPGAHDSAEADPAAELQKLGGASVIVATAPSGKSMSALVGGLGPNGTLMVVGAPPDPIEVLSAQLIFGRKRIHGWSAGIPTDSEETLRFAELTGVRPMIETYPFAKAAEGYARMLSGKAEFRVVLTM